MRKEVWKPLLGQTFFVLSGVSPRCSALSSRTDFPTSLKFEIRICALRVVPSAPRFSFLYYAHRLVNFSLCLQLRQYFLPALSTFHNEGAVFSVGGGLSEKLPAFSGQHVLSCPLRWTLHVSVLWSKWCYQGWVKHRQPFKSFIFFQFWLLLKPNKFFHPILKKPLSWFAVHSGVSQLTGSLWCIC